MDCFTDWYAAEVQAQIQSGISLENVKIDLTLSAVKPQHARWLIKTIYFLSPKRDILEKGVEQEGILSCFDGHEGLISEEVSALTSEQAEVKLQMPTEDSFKSDKDDYCTINQLIHKIRNVSA